MSTDLDDMSLDGDSLDGESRGAASEEVEWLSPDDMLEKQRRRYSFKRKADAPPVAARRKRGEPFLPSVDWTRAFQTQMNKQARDKVRLYACWRADMLKTAHIPCDDAAIDEWVHAAIVDTLDGRIRWKHETVTLINHLKDTIRLRSWRELERSKKFRHVSVNEPDDDQHNEADFDEKPTEVEASLASRRGRQERDEIASADTQRKILLAMRERAGADGHRLVLLDCIEEGVTEKADVLAQTGMSADDYHNARRRNLRDAMKISEELRANAMEAMTREPE